MDKGVPSNEELVERRSTPRSRALAANGAPPSGPRERREKANASAQPVVERRKSPPRPRKPTVAAAQSAAQSEVAVADRIDPLLAASSAALDNATEVAAAKTVRRRPPARKSEPVVPVDFFAEPALELRVDSPATESDEVPVPYVLPKIIPGEPEIEPELAPAPESILKRVTARLPFKPEFRGATERLKRSLQPVVLPRHRPRVRRVTRVVRHIDTWSVFKIAALFNIFLYAVGLTAGAMLWRVALNTGTIENIERFFESFGWQTFELKGGEIYHNAWIAGLFVVVGLTGLAVLAATMFNLITDLVGGVRLTVLEEEVVAREQRVVTWPRLLRPATPSHSSTHDQPTAEPPID